MTLLLLLPARITAVGAGDMDRTLTHGRMPVTTSCHLPHLYRYPIYTPCLYLYICIYSSVRATTTPPHTPWYRSDRRSNHGDQTATDTP